MAKNMIYSDTRHKRRVREVGSEVAPGTPVLSGGVPAVTVTGSGDYSSTKTVPGVGTFIDVTRGGVGLPDESATVAFDGTWAFDVEGADADTEQGTAVYLNADGDLTLDDTDPDTSEDNTAFGQVEFFRGELSATDTAVTIGL